MVVIGLMGTNGSGKDVVADYLVEKHGFVSFRSGDISREVASKRGLKLTRDNLNVVSKELYAKHGETFFVDTILKKIKDSSVEKAIFNGVRNPVDAKIPLQKLGNEYVLVLVDAKPEIRFERMKKRARPGFPKTLEKFKEHEKREFETFNMHETFKYTHKILRNDSTLEELYSQTEKLVKELLLI
ncbi:MAG: AAA family ATPase [Nanoarchaeota archaeon]|nr:AAA family ATPase [Nanoarchaeota archaeon]